jgi:hypothetical protein
LIILIIFGGEYTSRSSSLCILTWTIYIYIFLPVRSRISHILRHRQLMYCPRQTSQCYLTQRNGSVEIHVAWLLEFLHPYQTESLLIYEVIHKNFFLRKLCSLSPAVAFEESEEGKFKMVPMFCPLILWN